MRFNLRAAYERLLGRGSNSEEQDDEGPLSVVMLLHEPKVSTLQDLLRAGEQASGMPFSDDKESKYFVSQAGFFTFIKIGVHALSWMHFAKPYFEEGSVEFGKQLPLESQRQAWAQHSAWEAIDYVKSGAQPDVEYAVLARLCLQLLNSNCTGVYLPKDQMLVPNDGSAADFLKRLAAPFPSA